MTTRIGLSALSFMLCLVSLSACYRTTKVGGDKEADTNIDTNADSSANTSTDKNTDMYTDGNADTETNVDADTETNVDADTETNVDTGTNEDTDTDTGLDSESDTHGSVDERELEASIAISVTHSHNDGHTMYAFAYFIDMEGYSPFEVAGQTIYEEQGNDACILIRESDDASGGGGDYLDAGDVVLHIENSTFPMTQQYLNKDLSWVRYSLEDVTQAPEWFYGKTVSVSATGADAPAFTTENISAVIPESLMVTSPEQESVLPRSAINLKWSGGSGGQAVLEGEFFENYDYGVAYGYVDIHRMTCHVTDDGEFEIPAELVNLVPYGYVFSGSIRVRNEATLQVTPNYNVTLYAGSNGNFEYQLEDDPTP